MCSWTNCRESFRQGILSVIKNDGGRRRSDTVAVLTVDHVYQRLLVVGFLTPSALYRNQSGKGGQIDSAFLILPVVVHGFSYSVE